ncbi:MAG: hypothetical protein NZZ41_00475 [Candidatus Dojkabacteria bacterium]|nr:hypothetical protein [Candidatus Dojkabacteria bacterium]
MAEQKDHRFRLLAAPGQELKVYGSGDLTRPLVENSKGIIFPYTPNINLTFSAEYGTMDLTHVNDVQNFFNKRSNLSINIDGIYSCQTSREAHYALAVFHCLTSLTMMRFGANDPLRGTPPPILYFYGYGKYVFNGVPVIVESFNVNFSNNVDVIEVINTYNIDEVLGYLPSVVNYVLVLKVQRKPIDYLVEFNLEKFKSGELVKKGYR